MTQCQLGPLTPSHLEKRPTQIKYIRHARILKWRVDSNKRRRELGSVHVRPSPVSRLWQDNRKLVENIPIRGNQAHRTPTAVTPTAVQNLDEVVHEALGLGIVLQENSRCRIMANGEYVPLIVTLLDTVNFVNFERPVYKIPDSFRQCVGIFIFMIHSR
jgi:hypothetical protein